MRRKYEYFDSRKPKSGKRSLTDLSEPRINLKTLMKNSGVQGATQSLIDNSDNSNSSNVVLSSEREHDPSPLTVTAKGEANRSYTSQKGKFELAPYIRSRSNNKFEIEQDPMCGC